MAPKRKFQDAAHELKKKKNTGSKYPEYRVPEDSFQGFDMSKFPTEVLLEIFSYLNAKNNCAKPLIKTCTRFSDILKPRLALRLDFDRIYKEAYPEIKRSYTEVEFTGNEIDKSRAKIWEVLKTSRESVTKLSFTPRNGRCKIKLQTLLAILKTLPAVIELNMKSIQVLAPQLKFENAKIKEEDYPDMSCLQKLTVEDVSGPFLNALKNMTDLEELTVFNNVKYTLQLQKLISKLKKLTRLETCKFVTVQGTLPCLHTLVFNFYNSANHLYTNINAFKFAPMLETVKITSSCNSWLFSLNPSASVKSIEVVGTIINDLNVESILQNYPSLQVFKSENVNWKKA